MIDLDHVAVSAVIAGLYYRAAGWCQDLVAALTVNIHTGMKFIRAAAERIAAETEFIVYLAYMRPHIRQVGGIHRSGESL